MPEPIASVLTVHDRHGQPFGCFRIAPADGVKPRWDCIFDPAPSEAQQQLSEVRWLCKRDYRRWSEHRLQVSDGGEVTISQGDFKVVFEPSEAGGLRSQPPAPPVTASWG